MNTSATISQPIASLSSRFDSALAYASELHRLQLRKGSDTPYIAHLLSVCALVIEHGGTEDQAIAALLHDAVEDQGGEPTLIEIRSRYGDAVAQIVADCTDAWTVPKPPWRERKEAYLRALPNKPAASLFVSLADKVYNADAILRDYRAIGDAIWDRFAGGGRDGTIWYYQSLSAVFADAFPGPLAERLSALAGQFPQPQRSGAE